MPPFLVGMISRGCSSNHPIMQNGIMTSGVRVLLINTSSSFPCHVVLIISCCSREKCWESSTARCHWTSASFLLNLLTIDVKIFILLNSVFSRHPFLLVSVQLCPVGASELYQEEIPGLHRKPVMPAHPCTSATSATTQTMDPTHNPSVS